MPSFNHSIFKPYDIRGKYPEDFDEHTAEILGRAFVRFLKRKEPEAQDISIVVGRDSRESSSRLFDALTGGIRAEGANVADIGLSSTPRMYFSVHRFGHAGGIMITASHNPNPYNGFKLTGRGAFAIGEQSGLAEIKQEMEQGDFAPARTRGGIYSPDVDEMYASENFLMADVEQNSLSGLRIAVDAGNGSAGDITRKILSQTGCSVRELYFEPDGSFPHHIPDPLVKENLKDIIGLMKKERFDLGVGLDGDGDRVIFLDEMGTPIRGDLIIALVARLLLGGYPGAPILYDIRSSRIVEDVIREAGGIPSVSRIGHTFIKAQMRDETALFAGELSGHYYWGNGVYYETPYVVLMLILKELRRSGLRMSQLIWPLLQQWHHSGEINFAVEDKQGVLQTLEGAFPDARVSRLDGIRLDYPDWWFNARPSNTESLLRLVVEADSKEKLEEKIAILKGIIEKNAS